VLPIVSVTSSSQAYPPEETESEISHPAVEEPLHETIEIPKEVEEAYVPPVQTNLDKGKEPEQAPVQPFHSWDASRSVSAQRDMFTN
jgi:glycogenin glucosyltransferase